MRPWLIVFAFAGLHSVVAAEPAAPLQNPNIVLLLADDLGWTGLKCFGSDFYETPNLDRLAAEGMMFTDAYAACTVCSPTRASIMTGKYPARLHLTDFIAGQNRPFAKMKIPDWTKRLEPRHVTVAEVLKAQGYRTGHIGKWHLNGKAAGQKTLLPTDHGFDVSVQRPAGTRGYKLKGVTSESGSTYLTDYLTDKACDFIEQSSDSPFFLYFAYHVPHTPIEGRPDLVEAFRKKVDAAAVHNNPVYAAMVASLDQSVGRILKQLEESGQSDNTIVVFMSDNGGLTQRYSKHDGFTENLPLRRGKGSAYEGGVRVPMIVRWPNVTGAGLVCDEPVMTIDLLPTFVEMAAAAKVRGIDGVSLVPLLQDATTEIPRNLYWHYPHYHAGGDGPYSAVRSGRYRLIEFHEDGSRQLFDLKSDPGEQQNLLQTQPGKAEELTLDLRRWRRSVNAQMPSVNPDYDEDLATQVGRAKGGKRQRRPARN